MRHHGPEGSRALQLKGVRAGTLWVHTWSGDKQHNFGILHCPTAALTLWDTADLCSCPPACEVIQRCLIWGDCGQHSCTFKSGTSSKPCGPCGHPRRALVSQAAAWPQLDADALCWVPPLLRSFTWQQPGDERLAFRDMAWCLQFTFPDRAAHPQGTKGCSAACSPQKNPCQGFSRAVTKPSLEERVQP